MMLKIYPDRRWPAFLRVVADTTVVVWTVAWAYLGFLIYQTVMGLEVIADGIKNTGMTFNEWIAAFRKAVPGGIPILTKFLQDTADTLRHYSGDPLVAAGQNIHDAIIKVAIVLALLVALPPILLVLAPYAGWRWRDMRLTDPGGASWDGRSACPRPGSALPSSGTCASSAAASHSNSVASRAPAQRAKASASYQLTPATG